ncbi:MAG: hypothetical protein HOH98_08600 [Flavobacteriaceae bacterium]|nr:hypothetical protein [Flavobacteriaceae bacterium]
MNKEEQIKIINETIAKTKFTLKPLGYNFIFWGFLIISMSLFHYFFPEIVQFNVYSAVIYWVLIPLLGMIYTTYYNIKIGNKIGYETILGRVIKIIWGVFGGSWIAIVTISFYLETYDNPAQDILFLLGVTLTMSGLIIKFNKITLGGILLILFVVYTYFVPDLNFLLVNVVGITFGMLLPGFALYFYKENE